MIVAQISLLKFAWTLAALIGVSVTFALLFMSITDYRLLRERNLNGWRKHVAGTSIYIFSGGFLTQAIYFVAGVLSLTQPNSSGASLSVKHTTQALFLFGSMGSIILAVVIFYRRHHILEVIEKEIAGQKEEEGISE